MSDVDRAVARLQRVLKDKRDRMQLVMLTAERFIRQEVPVRSGHMRRTAHSRVERGGDRGVAGVDTPYARAVHFGYPARIIRPRRRKALFWRGAAHPVRLVKHPGYKGNPFLERTMRRLRPEVARVFGDKMFSGVR